jgi:hypothetical protein
MDTRPVKRPLHRGAMEPAAPDVDGSRRSGHSPTRGWSPEGVLRAALRQNPNDERSFRRLVWLLARRRSASQGMADRHSVTFTDDVTWALAVELATRPHAWFPLVELARLSLHHDLETALRRLANAVAREPTGRGLTSAVALLRRAGRHAEAYRLALAHWRPREHELAAGRQLVLAGLEAGRAAELRGHLDALASLPGNGPAQVLRAELTLRAHDHQGRERAGATIRDTRHAEDGPAPLGPLPASMPNP